MMSDFFALVLAGCVLFLLGVIVWVLGGIWAVSRMVERLSETDDEWDGHEGGWKGSLNDPSTCSGQGDGEDLK